MTVTSDAKGTVDIILRLQCRQAASVRRRAAELMCRYLGGDISLVQEVCSLRRMQYDLAVRARMTRGLWLGWWLHSVHAHKSCMLFAVDRIIELGSAFALLCFPLLLFDPMCSPLLSSALLSCPLLSSALLKTRADVSANCTDEGAVSHIYLC